MGDEVNIDSGFVKEVVDSFHSTITSRADLCKTCKSEYTFDFYQKKAYQELYALRFLPAYYFEYCVLANDLYGRVKDRYRNLKIMSLGCGLSPDYFAFRDNLNGIAFEYIGYDAVEWTSQKYMPKPGPNYQFVFGNVAKIADDEMSQVDVFVFPKSIGDIERGAEGLVATLGKKIAKEGKDRIFFLNSYVTKDFDNPIDKEKFLAIHKALSAAGYSTNDNPNVSYYKHDGITKDKPIGLRKIHYDFVYPPDRSVSCDKKDASDDVCNECMVPKSPIFTNQYMSFSILEYVRQ